MALKTILGDIFKGVVQSIPVVGKPLGNIVGNIQQTNRNPPAAIPPSSQMPPGIPMQVTPSTYTAQGQAQVQTQVPASTAGFIDYKSEGIGGGTIVMLVLGYLLLKKLGLV